MAPRNLYLNKNVHLIFHGLPLSSGQGFAFSRKQKLKHEYNKLLRREKKNKPECKQLYGEERYPEHLRHLYLAEAEKIRNEAWTNRLNRSKQRMKTQEKGEERCDDKNDKDDGDDDDDDDARQSEAADVSEPTGSGNVEPAAAPHKER